jgi:hypothetical protein
LLLKQYDRVTVCYVIATVVGIEYIFENGALQLGFINKYSWDDSDGDAFPRGFLEAAAIGVADMGGCCAEWLWWGWQ